MVQASINNAWLSGYAKRAARTLISIAFSWWGCAFALALLVTPYLYVQLDDHARMNRIHRSFATVKIGDTKEMVRDKLGPAVRSFPASESGFFSHPRHRLVYGREYQALPNWDVFRGRHFGFGIDRLRTFGPDADDYVVYFDSDGRVCRLHTPPQP